MWLIHSCSVPKTQATSFQSSEYHLWQLWRKTILTNSVLKSWQEKRNQEISKFFGNLCRRVDLQFQQGVELYEGQRKTIFTRWIVKKNRCVFEQKSEFDLNNQKAAKVQQHFFSCWKKKLLRSVCGVAGVDLHAGALNRSFTHTYTLHTKNCDLRKHKVESACWIINGIKSMAVK